MMLAFLKNAESLQRWTQGDNAVCALQRYQDHRDHELRMADLEQVDQAHRFAGKSALLGRGTYGVVTLMRHRMSGKLFAVKTLDKEVVLSTNMTSQVELELSAQQVMNHVNVVKCWNVEADDNQINLIMDYCSNGDLFRRLRASKMRMLPEREVFRLFVQLVAGVNHIHSLGFCHRDLKLENLLLDDEMNLKIADFGWVARVNGYQRNRNFCGTLDYLAPEMVTGSGHDWRIDNWAVGVLLYELSRGKPPFISTAHYDLLRRILDVEIHDDTYSDGESEKREYVCTRICGSPKCSQDCPVLDALINRRRLRGLAPDCLDVVKHFLRKDPSSRIELKEVLDLPWFMRMLREEYSRFLRVQVPRNEPVYEVEDLESEAAVGEDCIQSTDTAKTPDPIHADNPLAHHEQLSIRRDTVQDSNRDRHDDESGGVDHTYVVESESTPDNDEMDSLSSTTEDLTENYPLSEEEPQVISPPSTIGAPRALAWRSLTTAHARESLDKIIMTTSASAISRVNVLPEQLKGIPTTFTQTVYSPQAGSASSSSPRAGIIAPQRAVSLSCASHNSIRSQSIFPPPLQRRYTGVMRVNESAYPVVVSSSSSSAKVATLQQQQQPQQTVQQRAHRFSRQVVSNSSNLSWTLNGNTSEGVMSSEELSDKQTSSANQSMTNHHSRLWNVSLEKSARPVMSVRPLFH